jgi:hypothetical protein
MEKRTPGLLSMVQRRKDESCKANDRKTKKLVKSSEESFRQGVLTTTTSDRKERVTGKLQ